MEQKTKFIILGLVGILIISFVMSFGLYGAKQAAERERDGLKEENATLQQNLSAVTKESQQLKNKLGELSRDLDRISKERQDVQRKYDTANKERVDLIDTIDKLKKQLDELKGQQPQSVPVKTDDAYWGGILKAKADLEIQLQNIRTELKTLQINNEQLQREKSTLSLELTNLNREKEDLQRQLSYNQKLVDSMASELVREKNDKMQLENNVKPVKSENQVLMRQMKMLNERKISLEKDLVQLQADKNSLARRVDELESLLKDQVLKMEGIRKQVDDVRSDTVGLAEPKSESVELPPIMVHPQVATEGSAAEAKSLVGKVVAVNRDNNFVIIDLGENSGVKLGQGFDIYRGGKTIGGVEVIQIRKNISACDIKRENTPIKVGDTVK